MSDYYNYNTTTTSQRLYELISTHFGTMTSYGMWFADSGSPTNLPSSSSAARASPLPAAATAAASAAHEGAHEGGADGTQGGTQGTPPYDTYHPADAHRPAEGGGSGAALRDALADTFQLGRGADRYGDRYGEGSEREGSDRYGHDVSERFGMAQGGAAHGGAGHGGAARPVARPRFYLRAAP